MFLVKVRWLSAAALTLAHLAAAAQLPLDQARTEQVAVRLISDHVKVVPGQTVYLGLEQKIIPHWHTYWKNPGDSGTSTSIAWTLPAGVTTGAILWPAPSRFDIGPITNYGYADRVVLLTKLTVPGSQAIGSEIPVQAKASWLVCAESCFPQEATLRTTLAVAATASVHSEHKPVIDAALKQIPLAVDWQAVYLRQGDTLQARLTLPAQVGGTGAAAFARQHTLRFYPAQWGTVAHNAAQSFSLDGQQLTIALAAGETPPAHGSQVRGVLVAHEKTSSGGDGAIVHAVELGAGAAAPRPGKGAAPVPASSEGNITLWRALLLAFAGGVVLNLMPCVFPVLSIKALGLLKHSDLSGAQKRMQGVAYTAGVLVSFSLLALALIVIKSLGAQVGWGFQFQSPYFVLGVAYLIFVVGLSLSGVFALGGPANLGAGLASRNGYSGSFFTGVLATIVATPCTAPFMGAALGFALTQPSLVLWLVFIALGLGLALPYMLVSAWPALHRVLPKSGLWMERLKQALAFPMYAAAVWLVWVLAQQAGVNAVPLALGGMIMLALIAWLFDSTRNTSGARRLAANGVLLVATLATLGVSFQAVRLLAGSPAQVAQAGARQDWEAYSPPRLAELRQQGRPVFINLTAAWCITCLVNEKVALSKPAFKELLQEEGITYLKGDWTNQDARISALLKQYGRSGVPLYLFYPSGTGSEAHVLPQILTHDIVSLALRSK
ncbi:thiol:disulfide interchange protein [Massilia sp. CCM 8733]|uniref:Thiol:disulfide interchange protein n=1 Tax=Massilia mucilaginosa TaxID=2609282 RepID=A0ABX0P163_9BURK|nr:thioredoxin family protein [Massilia mucilaginosa]NHZ93039.1 thiol:disulfide interchange protein [Massilia mucilaginosa]